MLNVSNGSDLWRRRNFVYSDPSDQTVTYRAIFNFTSWAMDSQCSLAISWTCPHSPRFSKHRIFLKIKSGSLGALMDCFLYNSNALSQSANFSYQCSLPLRDSSRFLCPHCKRPAAASFWPNLLLMDIKASKTGTVGFLQGKKISSSMIFIYIDKLKQTNFQQIYVVRTGGIHPLCSAKLLHKHDIW